MAVTERMICEGLSPASRKAINEMLEGAGGPPLGEFPDKECSWLPGFLMRVDDEYFPKGKWATIQHVQGLLAGTAEAGAR